MAVSAGAETKNCQWCDQPFIAKRKSQIFCHVDHALKAANARRSGAALIGRGGYPAGDKLITDLIPPSVSLMDDKALISIAEERGYIIHKPEPQEEVAIFDTSRIKGDRVRLAIVSDTHIGSKYQQITYLREFLRYAKKRKCDEILLGGDCTDGPFEAHRGAIHEMWTGTYDGQADAFCELYPETKLTTRVISGNHDEFFLKNAGGDIVREICRRREDISYLGQSSGLVRYGDVLLAIQHPHDGMSYALSYKLQKRIESMSPENKPHILLLGNYHKAVHLPAYRNVEGFILPAFQSQTAWMAGKGLPSVVGGLILEFGITAKGLAPSFQVEWVLYREALNGDWPGA